MGSSIEVSDLTFTYSGSAQPSLRNVSLRIEEGEFVALFGASGSGKSTLCRCLNGLIPQFYEGKMQGRVVVCGMDTRSNSTANISPRVGMVFQNPENQLFVTSVEEELEFGLMNLGLPMGEVRDRATEALALVGMEEHRKSLVDELSAGQKQRIAIAATLVMRPEVLVLDEPASQLDPEAADDLLMRLRDIKRRTHMTIVLAEHRVERILPCADRVVILEDGLVVANGEPPEVFGDLSRIAKTGIRLPPVLRFAYELGRHGFQFGRVPLTVESATEQIPASMIDAVREQTAQQVQSGSNEQAGDGAAVESEHLSYTYENGVQAIRDVTLALQKGKLHAIMGPNGSGKSTFVRHLNGLLKPTEGLVRVCDVDTRKRTVAELSRIVALVFQNPDHQLFAQTVEKEVEFGPRNLGLEAEKMKKVVEESLSLMDLQGLRDRDPASLSYGQRQRVAVGSALSMGAAILVLDEPTTGQDYAHCKAVMGVCRELCRTGKTVLVVTHDAELVAEYCDSVTIFTEGRLVAHGRPGTIFYDERTLELASLKSPQIVQLARALKLRSNLVRVDELVNAFGRAISGAKGVA